MCEKLPLTLLVDFDTDDSFIVENLARQAGLPLVKLPQPKEIIDLDRCMLAKVMHRTDSLTILGFGNHCELISITSSSAP